MAIGIIGAMHPEIATLHSEMIDAEETVISNYKYFSGKINGKNVVLLESGIGKVSSAVGAALMISNFEIECMINTGCAGGLLENLEIGDIVVSDKAFQHDVDATIMGYDAGQIPGLPVYFEADKKLSDLCFEVIKENFEQTVVKGSIGTGDAFIGDDSVSMKLKEKFPSIAAVEMEGGAIAQCCYLMKVPFVIIRSLSDIAGSASKVDYREFMPKAAKISAQMVEKILLKL